MADMTERQKKWFASVRAGLETQTGRPMADWVKIAQAGCAGLSPRARSAWLKEHHGLGQNHAAFVLGEAFPDPAGWDDPAALREALWKDPASLAVFEAIEAAAASIDGLVPTQRKGYSAFSRQVQFAAARPLKGGKALLGLKLDPGQSPRLTAPTRTESWSERLTAVVELASAAEVDAEIARLLALAAERG